MSESRLATVLIVVFVASDAVASTTVGKSIVISLAAIAKIEEVMTFVISEMASGVVSSEI